MSTPRKVIIIGSGPAGLTAAIYTARANLAPLVIEGEPSSTTSDQPGGQLMLTTEVENFPGFPDGIMGPELMGRMREQAGRFGAEFLTGKVTSVDLSERPFVGRRPDDGRAPRRESIIVSTGAAGADARPPQRDRSSSATACRRARPATGSSSASQEIAVVGGGDSAVEEAIFLTKFAAKVTLVHRRDSCGPARSCRTGPSPTPRSSSGGTRRSSTIVGDEQGRGRRAHRHVVTGETSDAARHRAVRGHRPPAQHRPVQGPARHGRQRLPRHPARGEPPPTSTACSPAATCRTTPTGRRSPPPAPAAWPPSTPSGGSENAGMTSTRPDGSVSIARRHDRPSDRSKGSPHG